MAYMEQALWRALLDDQRSGDAEFFNAWLALQARTIKGANQALLFSAQADTLEPLAAWKTTPSASPNLQRAAASSIAEARPILRSKRPDTGAEAGAGMDAYAIAVPVIEKNADAGAIVVAVSQQMLPGVDPKETIRQLQWGAAWLRHHFLEARTRSHGSIEDRSSLALTIAGSCLSQSSFDAAAKALTVSLARALECDRVAFGIRPENATQLKALSNSADFSGHMTLVRKIEAAMDEAIDQKLIIQAPEDKADTDLVLRQSQKELSKAGGAGAVMTAPLFVENTPMGALTFERQTGRDFTADEAQLADTVASLVAPFLLKSLENEKWVGRRILDDVRKFLKSLFGPQRYARKAIAAGLIGFFLIGFLFKVPYAFDASAAIEGRIKRVVAAPIDGYIGIASKRAGDVVKAGEILATLDDRELRLQLEGWQTIKRQRQREFDRALAEADRSAISILQAQIQQADAQIGVLSAQLERTQMTAPFDGLVVSGDLAQSIGGSVQRGEVLFEITPMDGYRVVLAIDERDLDDVAVGQSGRLLLATFPDRPVGFEIVRVTPVAEVKDGRNVFFAEAALNASDLSLRPGMEGVAKIDAGSRRLFYIWTNETTEAVRLTLWRFWG